MNIRQTIIALAVTLAAMGCAESADSNPQPKAPATAEQAVETPQSASAEDMKIFERYIGTFRSESKVFDDGETEYYFTIAYNWYDQPKSIVKFTVSMNIPSKDRVMALSEGFYGYDPFNKQLYTFGVFSQGMTGWGSLGVFDHETGARSTWAKSMGPDGVVTHVRDSFEVIDEDHWTNKTSIRQGDAADWTVISEDSYSRVME
jgi:hypothetical protein